MRIASSGYVGIGTTSPRAPLEVSGSGPFVAYVLEAFVDGNGARDSHDTNWSSPYSIIGSYRVKAAAYDVDSDRRIKTVVRESDGRSDLATLLKIKITDFTFKDTVAKGSRPEKKVIAQQVEEVFPQVVSKSTGVVPDIFQKATVSEGWVKLATDLKVGERVRLMADQADGVHEVLEVEGDRFRTAFKPTSDHLFVYGREVKDFRSVDYEAIAMLNVSATQEIKREKDAEVTALREENAALRERLTGQEQRLAGQQQQISQLEARDRARDAKLAAIEKRLLSGQTVVARPASLTTAGGQE